MFLLEKRNTSAHERYFLTCDRDHNILERFNISSIFSFPKTNRSVIISNENDI